MESEKRRIQPEIEERIQGLMRTGDARGAVEAAILGYGGLFRRLVARRIQEPSAAEDAFSDFWLMLYEDLPAFRWESSFCTWASRVLEHHLIRFEQRSRRRRRVEPVLNDEGAIERLAQVNTGGRSDTHPYRKSAVRERAAALTRGVATADRELLALRFGQGLSWREIALRLGAGAGMDEAALRRRERALCKRVSRLLPRLRRALEKDGTERIARVLQRLSPPSRVLLEAVLDAGARGEEGWGEALGQELGFAGDLQARLRSLREVLRAAQEAEGLLPQEALRAGLVCQEELPRSGPARSGKCS